MKALATLFILQSGFLMHGCQPQLSTSTSTNGTTDTNETSNPISDPDSMAINLSWSAPTHRINGEELNGALMGYEIRYRIAGDTTYQSITLGANEPTSYRLANIPIGEYEVEIAAYDVDGIYSTFVKAAQE